MSLSSENPYATIRDLPGLPGDPRESSYVEMKGPPSVSPPRHPPHLRGSQRRQPQRDSGTYEQPSPLSHSESSLPPAEAIGHWSMGSGEGDAEGEEEIVAPLRGSVSNQALPCFFKSVPPLREHLRGCSYR